MGKNRPSCETVRSSLVSFLYGDLALDERQPIDVHVRRCAPCATELATLRQLSDDLDRLPVPLPSQQQWQGLEAKLASAMAQHRQRKSVVRKWPAPYLRPGVAAALVVSVGLLAFHFGGQRQQVRVGGLLEEVANLRFAIADVQGAKQAFAALAVTGRALAPASEQQRQALERLDGKDTPVRWYALARLEKGSKARERLQEICYQFPEHWLADEAFHVLSQKGEVRPRPLELAALQPLGGVAPPVPGGDRTVHYREQLVRLDHVADGAKSPKLAAFARLKAASIAQDLLDDRALARKQLQMVIDSAGEGPVKQAAERRLAMLQ